MKQTRKSKDRDFDLHTKVMARAWKPKPFATPLMALEVISGAYRGVIFYYKRFEIPDEKPDARGYRKVKFDLEILQVPDTLPVGWTPDDQFEQFASEIVFKWMSFVQANDLSPLLNKATNGTIH